MRDYLSLSALNIVFRILMILLLLSGLQAASSTENTLNISIGPYAQAMKSFEIDPTLSSKVWPDIGGLENYHSYTHYSPLIEVNGDGNIIPWMAESFEVSDDTKTVTFHLREGVRFADETPLNASILKFNFDRLITHGYTDLRDIYNLPIYIYYDYSEAADERTFKVHFSQGWLNVARDLSSTPTLSAFIHPQDVTPAWDIKGILRSDKRYNGLGPYWVDENESTPNQVVVLKKRHSWRDDLNFHKPKADKIVLKYIEDPEVAIKALEKGEIDYICRYWNPSLSSIVPLENNPKITIKTRPDARTYYLATAYWKEPFNGSDGILLRKAMCYAIDRKEIVASAFRGYATEAIDTMYLSPQLPEVPACCQQGYNHNPEMAKRLLSEAGWKDSDGDGLLDKNGKPLESLDLTISSAPGLEWMQDVAVIVRSQLKNIGIAINIQTFDYNGYKESRKVGDYELLLAGSNVRTYPMAQQMLIFNSSMMSFKAKYDNVNNSLADLVYNAYMASNREERDGYICDACNILFEDVGLIPLVHPMEYAIMSSEFKGFEFGSGWGDYEHLEECTLIDY
ncbi:MAG: putative ABC transporter periplasmic-binding protein [Methanosaeta sp. PtaB.Bin039]|nr:MAG: putative ABC transporter periplasmic-binding protein [Methanosaeta sp. PtaB.Bin039]